jgi:hypothetical protein
MSALGSRSAPHVGPQRPVFKRRGVGRTASACGLGSRLASLALTMGAGCPLRGSRQSASATAFKGGCVGQGLGVRPDRHAHQHEADQDHMVNCRPLSSGEACWSFSRAPGASEDAAPRGGWAALRRSSLLRSEWQPGRPPMQKASAAAGTLQQARALVSSR